VPCDANTAELLERELGVSAQTARLLAIRGLRDTDKARRFLVPSLEDLHDPFGLTGMREAVDRILRAIARGEQVAIHGDYDVDGVTSTVILRRALELLGADVVHFIPERLRDGYGLQPDSLEQLRAGGACVAISVDCGIRGIEAADHARTIGLDLIITDHHEPGVDLPRALAVINPKRHDSTYADRNLAGVGVAFKLVQALFTQTDHLSWLPGFVKIAAIGTLADVVPLVGENRVLAKLGLEMLSAGPHRVGLRALLDVCGLQGKTIEAHHVGFALAPRINAAGRMGSPDIAARLLLAGDESLASEARELAERLDYENQRRRDEEATVVAQARKLVDSDSEVGARTVLVVAGEGWHRGVIGIVASKLVETYQRPAIVLSIDGDTAHGSCRSLPSFDVLSALESCAELMSRFGGHAQAAGLTMEAGRLQELRTRVNKFADDRIGPDDLKPRLRVDGELGFRAINSGMVSEINTLAPFGPGNPVPVFQTGRVEVVDGPRRIKERHLKMSLRHEGRVIQAIAWRASEREAFLIEHRAALDVAFSVEENAWNGQRHVQLSLTDVRAPDP
jgi:single-stranded-DNA-specific exonuclease